MNEVFCLAEDNGIHVLYQDTDSGHYYAKDIPRLSELFKAKYHRELIGSNLGQFHSDFAELRKGSESFATKSVFCGKKSYVDMLSNDHGDIGFHARLKGIIQDVIAITANQLFPNAIPVDYKDGLFIPRRNEGRNGKYSVYELYKALHRGRAITFDLCCSDKPCFDMSANFSVTTKTEFNRRLQFI